MSIFNSLGSNYNFYYAANTLIAGTGDEYYLRLKKFLQERYGGNKVILTYKGRDALRIVLRAISMKGKTVGICGFTCFAVYDAVKKEGYDVDYLDIEKDSLNFSPETLKEAIRKNPDLKIVIVQNTLGAPSEVAEIAKICKENKIVLIEDLAHSIGTIYKNGKEAGTVGDFTIFSFSQDKVIDGVSGGALIRHNPQYRIENFQPAEVGMETKRRDRIYPLLTFLIRKTYKSGLGRLMHYLFKKRNMLSNPMAADAEINILPFWYCKNIYEEFCDLKNNLLHRKKIAIIYAGQLNKKVLHENQTLSIDSSTNLRFPIFVDDREELIAKLEKYNIYVSDIWYDAPIAPKKYLEKTDYKKGTCPNAENVSRKILNLPTHKNVTEKQALEISERINKLIT